MVYSVNLEISLLPIDSIFCVMLVCEYLLGCRCPTKTHCLVEHLKAAVCVLVFSICTCVNSIVLIMPSSDVLAVH